MKSEIRVYIEGDPKLKRGFAEFFGKLQTSANGRTRYIRPILCKNRDRALESFELALSDHKSALNLLLVDAEGPVDSSHFGQPWIHLQNLQSGRLVQPAETTDDQAHLMVQAMESWFLADRDMLQDYYGQGFMPSRLPDTKDVERISKPERALKASTMKTKKKEYHKTVHAPELLERINISQLRKRAIWCNRFCEILEKHIDMESI